MMFLLCNDFIIGNGHFRLKYRRNYRKPLKLIKNRCTHSVLLLFVTGKCAHRKGNIEHVRSWPKAIASNFSCFFTSKIAKDKCSHCAMALYYQFCCLPTAPSNRIIALWVHPFTCEKECRMPSGPPIQRPHIFEGHLLRS